MEEDRKVILTPDGTKIVKQCSVSLCQALQGKFQCIAQIHNVEAGADLPSFYRKRAIVPEMKYQKQLSNNLNVFVWKDDLTTHAVDAVVNAANEQLSHGAGLAGALSQAGGPMIQRCSDEIIRNLSIVNTGKVVCTPAGTLPCRMILHAVGPCVPLNPTHHELLQAAELLQETICNILKTAFSENLQSVAIPAISSGIFNFPLAKCAETIVKTLKLFGAKERSLEVRLVNHDDPSVQEMLNACLKILGSSDPLPKQNLGNPLNQSSLPSLDFGNVTLNLKTGSIEDETTDIIVNTTGVELDLSKGFVSKALLSKAGVKIQQELKRQNHGPVHEGDIILTSGYKLKCKAVLHTVCAAKPNRGHYHEQVLNKVVTNCLIKTCQNKFSTISFPALGTGNLGLQKDEVSRIMTTAVEQFSRTYTGTKLTVFFVIFPSDVDTLKAFKDRMDQTSVTLPSLKISSSTKVKGSGFHKTLEFENPFIELFAPSRETYREAKSWICRILCSSRERLEIHNNNIVHLSLADHEKLMNLQSRFHVSITEMFKGGHGGFIINGGPVVGVGCAAVEVEAMLCQAQENFAQNEEKYILDDLLDFGQEQIKMMSNKSYQKTTLSDLEAPDWKRLNFDFSDFSECGLSIVAVEKIENPALKHLFMLNSKRVQAQAQLLYQRVSAQFCDLICRVGFQREYAPPKEQKYGAGIYFTSDLMETQYLWPDNEEEYMYIIKAHVLTGKDAPGSPEMIVPPPIGTDPLVRYDSLSNKDIHVIFNGHRAYPEFLITCRKKNATYC